MERKRQRKRETEIEIKRRKKRDKGRARGRIYYSPARTCSSSKQFRDAEIERQQREAET